jgi:dTDP-4-amino-4,6-dideoxygalactose transaminase
MNIISYPDGFVEKLLDQYRRMMSDGQVAEGRFYNEMSHAYVNGKNSIPVNSGGSALFALLAFQKYVNNKTHVIIQSNTMRALYTIPRLLDMEVIICGSSQKPGFMAMDSIGLTEAIEKLQTDGLMTRAVAIYSVIGGYLSSSYPAIEAITRQHDIPLIVDAAHGHYLQRIMGSDYADLAFSFYATKILPAGEGGLVSTSDRAAFEWIKRFLAYDRFNYGLHVGLNLRASEFTAYFIHLLMTDADLKRHFVGKRVELAEFYRRVCIEHGLAFLDHEEALEYNGYKFIVFDSYEKVEQLGTALTVYKPTSPVFAANVSDGGPLLPHWCPPTYPSLYDVFLAPHTKSSRTRKGCPA